MHTPVLNAQHDLAVVVIRSSSLIGEMEHLNRRMPRNRLDAVRSARSSVIGISLTATGTPSANRMSSSAASPAARTSACGAEREVSGARLDHASPARSRAISRSFRRTNAVASASTTGVGIREMCAAERARWHSRTNSSRTSSAWHRTAPAAERAVPELVQADMPSPRSSATAITSRRDRAASPRWTRRRLAGHQNTRARFGVGHRLCR